ncbi:MAG: hypothetical protein ACP5IE_03725 [Infirmifilum sp.]
MGKIGKSIATTVNIPLEGKSLYNSSENFYLLCLRLELLKELPPEFIFLLFCLFWLVKYAVLLAFSIGIAVPIPR